MSGNRPSPLKINRDSHLIHKQHPSRMAGAHHQRQQQRPHPVIIYTHSPKVIHTRPHDFMALVQRLTGLTGSEEDQTHNEIAAQKTLHAGDRKYDNETSSGMTDEIGGGDHREDENVDVGDKILICFRKSYNLYLSVGKW